MEPLLSGAAQSERDPAACHSRNTKPKQQSTAQTHTKMDISFPLASPGKQVQMAAGPERGGQGQSHAQAQGQSEKSPGSMAFIAFAEGQSWVSHLRGTRLGSGLRDSSFLFSFNNWL